MKLHELTVNGHDDQLVILEFNDNAMIAKVIGAEQTYFISQLEDGPGFYDTQSNRHLNTEKHLIGNDLWEKSGQYIIGSEAARKRFRELSDPDALAGRAKDKSYGG